MAPAPVPPSGRPCSTEMSGMGLFTPRKPTNGKSETPLSLIARSLQHRGGGVSERPEDMNRKKQFLKMTKIPRCSYKTMHVCVDVSVYTHLAGYTGQLAWTGVG